MLRNNLKSAFVCLLLAGCGSTTLVPIAQQRAPVAIPVAQPMVLNPVQFKVYNADDLKTALADLQKGDVVLFTLDATNYQNLNLNLVEIKRYFDEQGAIIKMLSTIVNPDAPVPDSKTVPSAPKPPVTTTP